jgi:heptosyltransferase-2
LTEPVVRQLKRNYPEAKIDYLTKPQFADVVKYFSDVDNIIVGEEVKDLCGKLKSKSYDLVVDLHCKLRSEILKRVITTKKVVSYKKHHLLRRMITLKLSNRHINSTALLYLKALEQLNLKIDESDINPQLNIPSNFASNRYLDELKDRINEFKKPIAIFPGALHKTKQYPIEQLAVVINTLVTNDDYVFYLLGSKSERGLCESLVSLSGGKAINWCGEFPLGTLIPVVDKFSLVISNDSGPMHIAAALGKKQIAIFGATHPRLGFAPHNTNAIIVQKELSCRPCTLHGEEKCPKKHFNCMTKIYPEKILEAFHKLMGG